MSKLLLCHDLEFLIQDTCLKFRFFLKNCHRPLFGENKNYYSVVITITCNVVVKIIRKKNGITTMLLLCQENVGNGKQKLPHICNFVVKEK